MRRLRYAAQFLGCRRLKGLSNMFFGKSGGVSYIVVFLGNPGQEYESSRHNIGFMTAAVFEKKHSIRINRAKFNALTATCEIAGKKVLLMKPQTYMNLSGNAVGAAARFYKIPADSVLAVCDDMDMTVGKLRIRAKGSSGGHNGLKSIISALGTDEFPRIKIGVGSPNERGEDDKAVINWVLGGFSQSESKLIADSCEKAAEAVPCVIENIDRAMSKYN